MDYKQEISQLIDSIQNLSYRQESQLEDFVRRVREVIATMGPDAHDYINRLNKIRFKPASFFSTEMDYLKSWCQGQDELLKLLQELINAPAIVVSSPKRDESTLLKSSRLYERLHEQPELEAMVDQVKLNDIRKSMAESIDNFKSVVLGSLPASGATFENPTRVSDNTFTKESETSKLNLRQKIFTLGSFPGNLENHVVRFLQKQGVEVASAYQWPYQEESIVDICKNKVPFDYCVVFLSSEYCVFPKDQSPLKAKWTMSPNIIFQLGFLVGKLGRERVVVLYREDGNLKRPTQFYELQYINFDANNLWQNDLMTQLRKVGLRS